MANGNQALGNFAENEHLKYLLDQHGVDDVKALDTHLAKYEGHEPSGQLKKHLDGIERSHKDKSAAEKLLEKAEGETQKRVHQDAIDGHEKGLKSQGGKAHAHMDEVTERHNAMMKDFEAHVAEEEIKLAKLKGEPAIKAAEELEKKKTLLGKVSDKTKAVVEEGRRVVEEKTPVKAANAELTVSNSIKEAAEKAAEKGPGVIKRIGGNFKGTAMSKTKATLGVVGAVGLAASAAKNLTSSVGENGEEKPAQPVLALIKFGGSVGALAYAGMGGAKHIR